jgi:hypothetical protein
MAWLCVQFLSDEKFWSPSQDLTYANCKKTLSGVVKIQRGSNHECHLRDNLPHFLYSTHSPRPNSLNHSTVIKEHPFATEAICCKPDCGG